jgi:hypothetical protein
VQFVNDNTLTEALMYDPTTQYVGTRTFPNPLGTGDVNGPASAAVNQVAVYADATGKLIDTRNVTIDAGGNVVVPTGGLTVTLGNATAAGFVTNGGVTAASVSVASNAVVLTAGGVAVTNANVSVTTGNITIGTGNFLTSSGNVQISSGNLALPAPVNNSSTVGLITVGGQRFICNQSANTNYNLFMGIGAGNTTSQGGNNVCIGSSGLSYAGAGSSMGTGSNNTLVGSGAGVSITTGQNNTVLGFTGGQGIIGGSSNTLLGVGGGASISSGSRNIMIGAGLVLGNSISTGTDNILIGGTNTGAAGTSNAICIGATGINSATINIGTPATHTSCFIQGVSGVTTGGAAVAVLVDANGNFGTVSSAAKYKTNIAAISAASSARLHGLVPVTFNYIAPQRNEDGTEVTQFGLIADDVQKIIPEIVVTRGGEPETIRYDTLVPLLLAEIKQLATRVATLEQKNTTA